MKNARRNQREDWDLGPLAPKRDVGQNAETYGAMDGRRARLEEVEKEQRIRFWTIVPQDRVVIIQGRDKGKIGVVRSINGKTNGVVVEGLNMVRATIQLYQAFVSSIPRVALSLEADAHVIIRWMSRFRLGC